MKYLNIGYYYLVGILEQNYSNFPQTNIFRAGDAINGTPCITFSVYSNFIHTKLIIFILIHFIIMPSFHSWTLLHSYSMALRGHILACELFLCPICFARYWNTVECLSFFGHIFRRLEHNFEIIREPIMSWYIPHRKWDVLSALFMASNTARKNSGSNISWIIHRNRTRLLDFSKWHGMSFNEGTRCRASFSCNRLEKNSRTRSWSGLPVS